MTIRYFVDEAEPSHVRERGRQTGQTPETSAQSSPSPGNGETRERTRSVFSRNGQAGRTCGQSHAGQDTLLEKRRKPPFSKARTGEARMLMLQHRCFR